MFLSTHSDALSVQNSELFTIIDTVTQLSPLFATSSETTTRFRSNRFAQLI